MNFEQIKELRKKSDGNFGLFIESLIKNGVKSYEYFVVTGFTEYITTAGEIITSKSNGKGQNINPVTNKEGFLKVLASYKNGEINYTTFIKSAANNGVYSWENCLDVMKLHYYDVNGQIIVSEDIVLVN